MNLMRLTLYEVPINQGQLSSEDAVERDAFYKLLHTTAGIPNCSLQNDKCGRDHELLRARRHIVRAERH